MEKHSRNNPKLLGTHQYNQDFASDLKLLVTLPIKKKTIISDFFNNRENLEKPFSSEELAGLHQNTHLSESQLSDIRQVTHAIIKLLIRRKHVTLQTFQEELKESDYEKEDINSTIQLLETLLQTHSRRIREATVTNSVVDTISNIRFCSDLRVIYSDDEEIEDIIPVLLVRMTLGGEDVEKEIVFQLNQKKLNQLIEMLSKENDKLEKTLEHVQLKK